MTVKKAAPVTRPGVDGGLKPETSLLSKKEYRTEAPKSTRIPQESDEKTTSTLRDLYAASYCIAKGLRPVEVQPQGTYFLFVFPDPARISELLYEFTTDGLIEIRDYVKALRWLKSTMRHVSRTTNPSTRKDADAVEQQS